MPETTPLSVVVIGGTGFIGYNAAMELRRRGHRVTAVGLDLPTADLLPDDVPFVELNTLTASDEELRQLFSGQDALVFAAGMDDRTMPRRPAYPMFHKINVQGVTRLFELAREAGISRAVLCGSYFAYFDRAFPQWNLSKRHPYIKSRREQAKAAFEAGGDSMRVSVLELPYIFGSMPGRKPLWCPLVRYLRSPWPLFYTSGGTNMVSVHRVADAVAGAVVKGEHRRSYLVGGENRTWPELLVPLSKLVGRPKTVWTLPKWLVLVVMSVVWLIHRIKGVQSGLHPTGYIQLQTALTYFDPTPAQHALGFTADGLNEALRETVEACRD